LGKFCGSLLTEGYSVYERFTQQVSTLLHAQCGSHTRRQFEKAQGAESRLGAAALERRATFSQAEAKMREPGLDGVAKLAPRGEDPNPLGDDFFAWLKQTVSTEVSLPTHPCGQAAR
jgi:transposase